MEPIVIGLRLLRRRGAGWLAGGAALALAALLLVATRGTEDPMRAAVVASEPIAAGTRVDEALADAALGTVSLPAGTPLVGLISDPADVLGRTVSAGIQKGEPLTQASLGGAPGVGPDPLEPGERAVPVPFPTPASPAAGLRSGAHVDVVASSGEGTGGSSRVVVADAEVLALDEPSDGVGGEPSVVLRVPADEALRLTAATNFARDVRLLVRPGTGPDGALEPGQQAVAP